MMVDLFLCIRMISSLVLQGQGETSKDCKDPRVF